MAPKIVITTFNINLNQLLYEKLSRNQIILNVILKSLITGVQQKYFEAKILIILIIPSNNIN